MTENRGLKRTLVYTHCPPHPIPACQSARSHEARLERMGMMQPWCREIAG